MIFIIAALLALVAAGTGFYISYKNNNKDLDIKFQNKKSEVFQELQEKKSKFDSQLYQEFESKKQELNKQLEEYNIQIQQKQEKIYQEFENLDNEYCEYKKNLDNQREVLLKEHQDKIISEDRIYIEKIKEKEILYSQKIESLKQELENFLTNIENQKTKVKEELKVYEDKQAEIIKRFKEDEEKRQQIEFYKIKINENDKRDIENLKRLSSSFSRPDVLYKVIYETYYKAKLEEMFKRVLGDKKESGGIYKITNINNNKVYIGKTTNFISRWRTHAKRGCGLERISGQLYDAMFEDGLENYMWEIVEVCQKEEQTQKEKDWIKFYKSNEYGYNQKVG